MSEEEKLEVISDLFGVALEYSELERFEAGIKKYYETVILNDNKVLNISN